MYCDYFILFFKIKCPREIPNIQGIWEICPGNQWFQVGKSGCAPVQLLCVNFSFFFFFFFFFNLDQSYSIYFVISMPFKTCVFV